MATDLSLINAVFSRMNTLSTSRTIAWPGVDFTPPSDGSGWLKLRIFPNEPNNLHYANDAKQQYIGFIRVSVVDPEGSGIVDGTTEAEAVQAHFPKGHVLGPVQVRAKPYISPAIHEGGRIIIPVTVPYQGIAT